jgi:hypothetical protein
LVTLAKERSALKKEPSSKLSITCSVIKALWLRADGWLGKERFSGGVMKLSFLPYANHDSVKESHPSSLGELRKASTKGIRYLVSSVRADGQNDTEWCECEHRVHVKPIPEYDFFRERKRDSLNCARWAMEVPLSMPS